MRKSERLNPEQFLTQYYYPADTATEQAVETLRILLGLQDRDTSREAVSGFLVACRNLLWMQADILGFPHVYEHAQLTYKRMREELVALGYIILVRKGYKDSRTGENSISTYKVLRFPAECQQPLRFANRPPERLLTVREHKTKFRWATDHVDKGKVLSVKECRERFGEDYDIAELWLGVVHRYLQEHPLEMDGVSYTWLCRKFNNGRLDRGGRIYTSYTSLKKKKVDPETGEISYPREAATIDGEKVALIDISASFLCVRAGMAGKVIKANRDPYSRLSFVVDKPSRDFAKVLVSSMIANGGTKKRYSPSMHEDFAEVIGNNKISYFTDAVYAAYPFLLEEVDGLEVMFIESEIMMETLKDCVLFHHLPAWPLHDAIFVKQSQVEDAKAILSDKFERKLGFIPRLGVDYLEGNKVDSS